MKYISWLWNNTGGFRLNLAIRIFIGIGRVSLGLLMVWLSKHFIDETIRKGSDSDVVQMIALLVSTVLGMVLLRITYYYMTNAAMVRKSNRLRLDVFKGLFLRKLFEGAELHSGDVASRLSKDIETISSTVMETLPQMLVTALQLLGAFLLMRWFDPRLAWALLLLTPVAIVFGKLVSRKLKAMTLAIRDRESKIQMQVQEGVEFNVVLRSLESESWVASRLKDMQRCLEREVLRRTRFTTISRFALGSVFGLGYMLAFVWGGLGLRDGTITFGMMTSFLQLVGQIQNPILSILNMVPQVVHTTASIDRLQDLDASKESEESSRLAMDGSLGVRVEDVHFGYASGTSDVLDGFSHDFYPGSKTAIMGKTGIGKTTLFRLLLGFIRPSSGSVKIYSKSAEYVVGKNTRSNFVYVPQGNTLLSGTVRLNLQMAKPDATDNEMRDALHAACADFVLDLPQGLDFELGERGRGLSEGQAQRIAIARGLLRPGNVWLFDEVSSSLDESTEHELFKRLFETYPDKTMIFVTHRGAICELCTETLRF